MLNMIWIDGIRSRNLDKPHFRQYLPPHPAQDSTRLVDVSHNLEVSVYQQSHLGPSDTVQAGQSGPGDLTRPVSQILVIINLENIGKSVFNIQTYEISRAYVFSWEAGGWPKFTWLSSPPWSWCRRDYWKVHDVKVCWLFLDCKDSDFLTSRKKLLTKILAVNSSNQYG